MVDMRTIHIQYGLVPGDETILVEGLQDSFPLTDLNRSIRYILIHSIIQLAAVLARSLGQEETVVQGVEQRIDCLSVIREGNDSGTEGQRSGDVFLGQVVKGFPKLIGKCQGCFSG